MHCASNTPKAGTEERLRSLAPRLLLLAACLHNVHEHEMGRGGTAAATQCVLWAECGRTRAQVRHLTAPWSA
jgi:hypothetical protein